VHRVLCHFCCVRKVEKKPVGEERKEEQMVSPLVSGRAINIFPGSLLVHAC
jgi:hypothetical protein